MTDDLREQLVDHLNAERPAVEQALATLRFDEQRVLKGRRLGPDQGDAWRVDTRDDTDHLAPE